MSVGAALFVILGAGALGEGPGTDPTRVAAQVVSGIGFLGAGVILRDGLNIRGITTAATLWCAAAIGSLAGAGAPWIAVIGAAAIVATNTLLRPLSRFINRRTDVVAPRDADEQEVASEFMLEVVTTEKSEARVRALVLHAVSRPELTLRGIETNIGKAGKVTVMVSVSTATPGDSDTLDRVIQRISLDPKVMSSRWWVADVDD